MAAFYSSHLAAVSERLCLGPVSVMQDAMLLRRANVTHAVIVCSHAQLRHAASPQELSVAEVLTWLLADAQLAQAVRSCAAAGVQAKLVSVKQPDKVVQIVVALPALCRHSTLTLPYNNTLCCLQNVSLGSHMCMFLICSTAVGRWFRRRSTKLAVPHHTILPLLLYNQAASMAVQVHMQAPFTPWPRQKHF